MLHSSPQAGRGEAVLSSPPHTNSREQPVQIPARAFGLAAVESLAVEPDPRARVAFDPEVVARELAAVGRRATTPWRCAPALRRAPPRACTCRQRNRTGGPSGTSAMASTGSGRWNRRIGRVGRENLAQAFPLASPLEGEGWARGVRMQMMRWRIHPPPDALRASTFPSRREVKKTPHAPAPPSRRTPECACPAA